MDDNSRARMPNFTITGNTFDVSGYGIYFYTYSNPDENYGNAFADMGSLFIDDNTILGYEYGGNSGIYIEMEDICEDTEDSSITIFGDIIITNDPYSGAAHLCDIYMYQPIFIGEELAAWAVAGGHQRDVGGAVPGSGATNSTEIYQEGLRIPPLKLYKKGVRNDDLYKMIKAASRTPEIIEGDIEAFRASCNSARERFYELVEDYSWETLKLYFGELLNYAERLTRAEIRAMPDGEYEFIDYLDDGGRGYVDDAGNVIADLIPIHVKITVNDDEITYDFTGTSPQVRGAMNNPFGTTRATVMACLRYMIDTDIPRNGGAFRPVKIIAPEGSLLNPRLPAACASRGATLGRQTDAVLGAARSIW